MSEATTFNIYVMSANRWNHILTKDLFEYCTYVVREEQADYYRKAGVEKLLVIPKGEGTNFMMTFHWIVNHAPEDVILICDDDIKSIAYRLDTSDIMQNKDGTPDKETATLEAERIAQLIYDLDIGLAFVNPQAAPYVYISEFSFKGMPGGLRWVNRHAFKAKYIHDDPCSSDIDMMMQELLMNRVCLMPRYLVAHAFMDTNTEGTVKRKYHVDLQLSMMSKWGKYYDYNFRKNIAYVRVDR